MKFLRPALLLTIAALSSPTLPLAAKEIEVSNEAELQSALNEASNNGEDDTILLKAGHYSVWENEGKPFSYLPPETEHHSLTLIGEEAKSTVLDGENTVQVMQLGRSDSSSAASSVRQSPLKISQLTFTSGHLETGGQAIIGGGGLMIFARESAIEIASCIFKNNLSINSGGSLLVYLDQGDLKLTQNFFTDNSASTNGGALAVYASQAAVLLQDNEIKTNQAPTNGGGAFIEATASSIRIADNVFAKNDSKNVLSFLRNVGGGGLYVKSTENAEPIWVANNIFYKNSANNGAGALIHLTAASVSQILHNNFVGNYAFDVGGGLHSIVSSANASTEVFNNIFLDNSSDVDGQDVTFYNDNPADSVGPRGKLFHNHVKHFFIGCSGDLPCMGQIELKENFAENVRFEDVPAGDFHLQAKSACIDRGFQPGPGVLPATDFEGEARIMGPAPDVGADEVDPLVPSEESEGGCSLQRSKHPSSLGIALPGLAATILIILRKSRLTRYSRSGV